MTTVKVERRHREAAMLCAYRSEATARSQDWRIIAWRDGERDHPPPGENGPWMEALAWHIAAAEQRTREECAAKLDALAALIDSEGDDARENRKAHGCETPQYLEGVADKSELYAQKMRALAKAWREGGGA